MDDRAPYHNRVPSQHVVQINKCTVFKASALTDSQKETLSRVLPAKNLTLKAVFSRGKYVRKAGSFNGACELFYRVDDVAKVLFPYPLERRSYSTVGKFGSEYVALETLGEELHVDTFPLEESIENGDVGPRDHVLGAIEKTVSDTFFIEERKSMAPGVHRFVSISVAVSAFKNHRSEILRLVNDEYEPIELPYYEGLVSSKRGRDGEEVVVPGKWVSSLDLWIACNIRGTDINLLDENDNPMTIAQSMEETAMRSSRNRRHVKIRKDGKLDCVNASSGGSGMLLSIDWLRGQNGHSVIQTVLALSSAAQPGAPILLDMNPLKAKPSSIPRGSKICSVKMTIKKHLKEPDVAIPFLESVCDAVSEAARYASYILNLHAIRLLDQGGGFLTDVSGPDCFDLPALARNAHQSVRHEKPKHPSLCKTFEQYKTALEGHVDRTLAETGNCIGYEATSYCSNAYNAIHNHGAAKVSYLFCAARAYYGGIKGDVFKAVKYVENMGQSLEGLHEDIVILAQKYRKLYSDKGLHDSQGFKINDVRAPMRRSRFRRCLEIFWNISQDLQVLEETATSSGRFLSPQPTDHNPLTSNLEEDECYDDEVLKKADADSVPVPEKNTPTWKTYGFSLLPVAGLHRRFVTIDKDILARAVFKKAFNINTIIPNSAYDSLLREDKRRGRNGIKGWKKTTYLRTDATSLIETCFMPPEPGVEKFCSKPRKRTVQDEEVDIPPTARRVGDDPGRKTIHCVIDVDERGNVIWNTYTRKDHYQKLEPINKSRERRVNSVAREALEALSSTRRKSAIGAIFADHVAARALYKSQLHEAYGTKKSASERFSLWQQKTKSVDQFVVKVVNAGNLGRKVWSRTESKKKEARDATKMYWCLGNAKFNPTGPGEKAVPTSSFGTRLTKAFKEVVDLVQVSEYGTTKYDAVTFEELEFAWRRGRKRGGAEGWIKDHDVRFRKSGLSLESYIPCPAHPSLLEGLKEVPQDWVPIHRDGNAAYTIRRLGGVKYSNREPCFRHDG